MKNKNNELIEISTETEVDLYRSIVETQTDLICRLGLDGSIKFSNPAYQHYFSSLDSSPTKSNFLDNFSAPDRKKIQASWQDLTINNPNHKWEQEVIKPSGEPNYIEWKFQGIFEQKTNQLKIIQVVGTDITECQIFKKTLQENQLKYQTLFQILPLGISITDDRGEVREYNSAAETILGLPLAEHFDAEDDGQDWQIISPDGTPIKPSEFASIRALKENRVIENWEAGVIRPDGKIVWISVNAAPINLPNYGVATTYIDITKQKQIEADLKDSEERFRQIAENISDIFFLQSADFTRSIYVSKACEKIWGHSPEKFYQEPNFWLGLIHPEDREKILNILSEVSTKELCAEYRIIHPSGEIRWLRTRTFPVTNQKGEVYRIAGITEDITQGKNSEIALQKSENLLRRMAANIPGMIYQFKLDSQGKTSFSYISPNCREIYELEPDYLQKNPNLLMEMVHPEDTKQMELLIYNSLENLTPFYWEGRIIVNQKIKWIQSVSRPEKLANGDMIWNGMTTDITARKKTESQLAKINQCFLNFTSNHGENISNLTKLCGEILDANLAVYSRLKEGKLLPVSQWKKKSDTSTEEKSQAQLCYAVTNSHRNNSLALPELFNNNPNIQSSNLDMYGLNTYLANVVKCQDHYLGSLCIFYQQNFLPNQDEKKVISIIASAIGIEEERLKIEEALRQQMEREKLINAVAQRIRQSLELPKILATTVVEVRDFINCDQVFIYRFNNDNWTGSLVAESLNPSYSCSLNNTQKNVFFQDITEHYQCGKIQIINNIYESNLADSYIYLLEKNQVKSSLIVPVFQSQEVGIKKTNQSVHKHNEPLPNLWGLIIANQCQTHHNWQPNEIDFLSQIAIQVGIATQQSQLYQQLKQANYELHRLATLDGLTHVANRRRFNEYLDQEWRRLARERIPLALIMCDIDFFKAYNDTYGHQAGDDCLIKVAETITKQVKRPADLVARYGGEEFAVILPYSNAEGAMHVAQQIRNAIKELLIPHISSPLHQVTISLGVTSMVPSLAIEPALLIEVADRALYQAKKSGRDRALKSTIRDGDLGLGLNSPETLEQPTL